MKALFQLKLLQI